MKKSPIYILLAFAFLISVSGCKSSKKLAASKQAAEKAKMEQEANLRRQREQEQEAKRKADEDAARRNAQAASKAKESTTPKTKLAEYFTAVANAGNDASANNSINEALTMFASPEALVLIIISNENGAKDYDKPTTIKAYLNYLKDQKKNINAIDTFVMDNSGKITELELKRNN